MLWDGDCGFCRRHVGKWRRITGDAVRYAPYQEALSSHPQVTEEECRTSVRVILPDGRVLSGAKAVFTALSLAGKRRHWLWMYDRVPLFARVAEFIYAFISARRSFFSKFS